MPSLTRAEATARAATVEVHEYEVDLDLTAEGDTFGARTVVRFAAQEGASTFLEFEPVSVTSMTLNGAPLPESALTEGRMELTGLAEANELAVEAVMRYSNTGEGLHKYVDPADGSIYVYQHMFINNAGRILPAFDQPDLKASYRISVTAPASWRVAANGPLRSGRDGRWEFEPTKPISTYLCSLIAGPYHEVTDSHDGIPLALYARAALAEALEADAPEIFEITKQCFDRYHEIFDIRYPFGHYQQAFAPEFNFGAMEYPGLVVFRDEFIYRSAVTESEREHRANVIAHEMAHMWFGDLVTMAWWDDLWLNESFAEYMGTRITAEATRFPGSWTTFAMQRKAWGLRADQHPSTHPVAPADVTDTDQALLNFDGISYAKGAAVLKQLVAWVGEEAFRTGVNAHFEAHAYGNATLADLLGALSKSSGRDLSAWADVWLRRAQVNTLRTAVRHDGSAYESVAVEQTAPESYPTLRPHRLGIGLWDKQADGTVKRRKLVEAEIDATGRTEVPELAGEPVADLLLLNDGDLTYAKIRLDEESAAAVPVMLPLLGDSLARAVLWAATLDAVVDGERPVAELVTLVLAALPVESEVVIVEDVLRATRSLVDRYSTPETRPAALELVAQAADRLLAASEPGGSRQLAAARGLIGATVDTARLRNWLAGEHVPDGLAIDADLRWLIVYRLAVLGAAGADVIDAEFERDRSATGEQWAARCRAARPDAEAKAAAWEAIISDAKLSNRLVEMTASGFWQAEQIDLVRPYVARYFAEMPAMMRIRNGMSAERTAGAAYPSVVVEPRTRELAAGLLADEGLDPILRRVVLDADDDLRRALAARF
ncbi:aminopeptidase N [Paractinoplanes brasiliensis]|uniref:Aminopeptidase N n=1 Tax=Paractinoplanes brasiliensis TaxID=52695 RepID=A0A4R6JP07_9ACTN|nr:aminopeptidase N [Actinoplanes brasiliensis]TDO38140.1 membrane alanyl aminopeptidase [Actinoplanes brasiliensis]GID33260.1 aminopeptidase [Actinoplanes brasiliensis]